ncbi:MAG: DUF2147 domain-containing protein [Paracoccaceae bacterium]
MRLLLGFAAWALALPFGADLRAETLSGLWLTGPDAKGQVGHVRLASCGAAICGTVLKAFDRNGQPVATPNIGKRVIWDVKPSGSGYAGRMHVSQLKADVDGTFQVAGKVLTVRGCMGPVCQSQRWKRID